MGRTAGLVNMPSTVWTRFVLAGLAASCFHNTLAITTTWKCQCSGTTLAFPPSIPPGSPKKYGEAFTACHTAGYSLITSSVDIQCLRDYLRHIISSYDVGYPVVWVADPSFTACHVMTVNQAIRAHDCNIASWFICAFRQSSPIVAPNIANALPILPAFSHTAPSTKVTYSCDAGYQIAVPGAQLVSECTGTSSWTHPVARCVVKRCPMITVTSQLLVSYSHGQDYQSVAVLSCNTGYVTQGTTQLTCSSSGSWSHTPAVCVAVRCPSPSASPYRTVSTTGLDFGVTSTYSCVSGYRMSTTTGHFTATCQADRTWSAVAPVCEAVNCGKPQHFLNSVANYSTTTFGSSLAYTCSGGYSLTQTSHAVTTCTALGKWSQVGIGCVARTCAPLDHSSTSHRSISYLRPTLSLGAIAIVTCDQGYAPSAPSSFTALTCLEDGNWDKLPPACIDVDECLSAVLHDCDAKAVCTNTDGSYRCSCSAGYQGNGTAGHCHGVEDPVSPGKLSCSVDCLNGACIGNNRCECHPGYTGQTCQTSLETESATSRASWIHQNGNIAIIAVSCVSVALAVVVVLLLLRSRQGKDRAACPSSSTSPTGRSPNSRSSAKNDVHRPGHIGVYESIVDDPLEAGTQFIPLTVLSEHHHQDWKTNIDGDIADAEESTCSSRPVSCIEAAENWTKRQSASTMDPLLTDQNASFPGIKVSHEQFPAAVGARSSPTSQGTSNGGVLFSSPSIPSPEQSQDASESNSGANLLPPMQSHATPSTQHRRRTRVPLGSHCTDDTVAVPTQQSRPLPGVPGQEPQGQGQLLSPEFKENIWGVTSATSQTKLLGEQLGGEYTDGGLPAHKSQMYMPALTVVNQNSFYSSVPDAAVDGEDYAQMF